jgi:hypothetical protein
MRTTVSFGGRTESGNSIPDLPDLARRVDGAGNSITIDNRFGRLIYIAVDILGQEGNNAIPQSWQWLVNLDLLERAFAQGPTPLPGDPVIASVQRGNNRFTDALVTVAVPPPALTCLGFEPPLDGPVVVKKPNRVLPLRMTLVDADGNVVTSLADPPVVNVYYEGAPYYDEDGEPKELDSVGRGDDGNKFVFNGTFWAFNLSTRGLAAGTYTIWAVSGNDGDYVIPPDCVVEVVIE